MTKIRIPNTEKKERLSFNEKGQKPRDSTSKAKGVSKQFIEKLAKPKKYDKSVELKANGNKIFESKGTLRHESEPPKEVYKQKKFKISKEATIELQTVKPFKSENTNRVVQLRHNQKSNIKSLLPSILKSDIDKNKMISPQTLPSFETLSQSIEVKNKNQLITSFENPFERGFIKNKYKDLLESLKC